MGRPVCKTIKVEARDLEDGDVAYIKVNSVWRWTKISNVVKIKRQNPIYPHGYVDLTCWNDVDIRLHALDEVKVREKHSA